MQSDFVWRRAAQTFRNVVNIDTMSSDRSPDGIGFGLPSPGSSPGRSGASAPRRQAKPSLRCPCLSKNGLAQVGAVSVQIIKNEFDPDLAAANNQAAKLTAGKRLAFLNSDFYPDHGRLIKRRAVRRSAPAGRRAR